MHLSSCSILGIKLLCIISLIFSGCKALRIPQDSDISMDQLSLKELEHLSSDPVVTHKVIFTISKRVAGELYVYGNSAEVGKLTIGLFGFTVPITVENFIHLSNMTFGYGYKNTIFHRVIKDFMIQGGDFDKGDGTGGHSIFNDGKFNDENFAIKHDKQGRLSMANSGPNTNGAQFFITTANTCSHLDGHHVVFGQLIDGFDILRSINKVTTNDADRPVDDVFISGIKVVDFKVKDDLISLGGLDLTYSDLEGVSTLANGDHTVNLDEVTALTLDETSLLAKYKYLFIICVAGIGWIMKTQYYRRQAITDIKDHDYY